MVRIKYQISRELLFARSVQGQYRHEVFHQSPHCTLLHYAVSVLALVKAMRIKHDVI